MEEYLYENQKNTFLKRGQAGGNGGNKNPWNPGSIPDGKK